MSVRVTDRKQSRVEFLESLRKLNVRIGQIVANGPQKYRANYGDHVVRVALEAYEHAQIANSIYLNKGHNLEQSFRMRRENLLLARGKVHHLASACDIYFNLVINCDKVDRAKTLKRMEDVGNACNDAIKLIGGVMKSDTSRYREYNGQ